MGWTITKSNFVPLELCRWQRTPSTGPKGEAHHIKRVSAFFLTIERMTIAIQRLPPEGHYCLFWSRLSKVDPTRLLARAVPCSILPKSAHRSALLIYHTIVQKEWKGKQQKVFLDPKCHKAYLWPRGINLYVREDNCLASDRSSLINCTNRPKRKRTSVTHVVKQTNKKRTFLRGHWFWRNCASFLSYASGSVLEGLELLLSSLPPLWKQIAFSSNKQFSSPSLPLFVDDRRSKIDDFMIWRTTGSGFTEKLIRVHAGEINSEE